MLLIRSLRARDGVAVKEINIDARPRSIRRYLRQFLIYPVLAMRAARSHDLVVIYQEDLSYLIPFIRLVGGRACIIFHHVMVQDGVTGVVERAKALYLRLMQYMVSYANLVLVPSEATARDLQKYTTVRRDVVRVIPCPFDDRYFDDSCVGGKDSARSFLKEKFGVDLSNRFVILNVGSDEGRKNNIVLFDGAEKLKAVGKISLVRVGEAINMDNRRRCQELTRNSGIHAFFFDKVDDDDLQKLYQASDAYASPSLHEGFGRTVIEAQIAGLPVIASDLQVYRDNMRDTFRPVENPRDGHAWAEAIWELMTDQIMASRLIESGRKNAKRFSIEVVGNLLNRTLEEFLCSRGVKKKRHGL